MIQIDDEATLALREHEGTLDQLFQRLVDNLGPQILPILSRYLASVEAGQDESRAVATAMVELLNGQPEDEQILSIMSLMAFVAATSHTNSIK